MGSPARREPEAAGVQEADNFWNGMSGGCKTFFNRSAQRKNNNGRILSMKYWLFNDGILIYDSGLGIAVICPDPLTSNDFLSQTYEAQILVAVLGAHWRDKVHLDAKSPWINI